MKALIVDIGNSRIVCSAWSGDQQYPALVPGQDGVLAPPVPLEEMGSWEHASFVDGAPFTAEFQDLHADSGCPPVVLVSVVPHLISVFPESVHPEVVDHTCRLPFILDVDHPASVGPDRLCNMASASGAGLKNALVVDAGTATTFDLLLDGVFVGGMIAPGMAFAARKLGETAARLDPVPFGPVSWDAGRGTASAMAAGAWHTGTGGVRHVVAGLQDRYGELPVVVTGGLGGLFGDSGWFYDPEWTLRGAAILSGR
jgi:pantothenate kinase type III